MIYEAYEGEIMFGQPKSILRWDDWWMRREQWPLCTLILVKSFSTDKLMKFKLGMWVLSWTASQLSCWVQRIVIGDTMSCQRPSTGAVPQGPYWVQYCITSLMNLMMGQSAPSASLQRIQNGNWCTSWLCCHSGGPQEMKKWDGKDLTKFSKVKCQAFSLGRINDMDWSTLGSSQLEEALKKRTWGSWGHLADHEPGVYPCEKDGQPPPGLH